MKNISPIKIENRILQREIYLALSNPILNQSDKLKLQNNFTHNFYEVLKISFDSQITKEKLNKFTQQGINPNSPNNLLRIARVIENEKTYQILNIFLKEYLNILNQKLLN